jgi:hypothetical protein
MADREAAIKLTLDDGQFVAAMGKSGDAAVRAAQRSEKAMQVFGAGVKKATSNLGEMAATARSSLGMVGGLLGGLTFGSALKGAVELDAKFKQLAFRVSTATREQVKHTDLQRLAEQAAIKTGRRTVEMADAYEQLFAATGDRDFADNMLETIGEAATATGQEISTLTSLADQMHTKFGVAAEDMGDVFGQVFEAAQMGGPSFQEFADVASNMGAELLNAGLDGRRGLDFMLGALVQTDDAMGNLQKQVKGIKQILLSLGDQAQITAIAKALHIDPKKLLNEKDLMARMRRILGMGKKGLDAIKGSMKEAEEQKALKILFTDPFEQALKQANESGLKGKAAIDSALAVLDGQISNLGKSLTHGTHLQDEAQRRMNDPQRRLERALETLTQSFSDPRIIEAVEDLSKMLPSIASGMGKLAKFVVNNPWLSGAAAVGGKAGMGFVSGAVNEALGEAFREAFGFGGGGGGGGRGGAGGKGGGGSGRRSSLERHHQMLGEGLTEAQLLGNVVEDEIADGGKKGASKMATAMRLAAVAALAGVAYEIGEEQIDNAFGANASATSELSAAGASAASTRGPLSKHKAERDRLRVAIAKAKEESGGFMQGLFGLLSAGGGDVDEMGNPIGTRSDDGPNLQKINAEQIAEMEQVLKEKEALIAKLENPSAAAAPGGKGIDGKAVADAMKAGAPLRVEVVNQPTPAATAGRAGPGGSRGVKPPAAQAPGGGY